MLTCSYFQNDFHVLINVLKVRLNTCNIVYVFINAKVCHSMNYIRVHMYAVCLIHDKQGVIHTEDDSALFKAHNLKHSLIMTSAEF